MRRDALSARAAAHGVASSHRCPLAMRDSDTTLQRTCGRLARFITARLLRRCCARCLRYRCQRRVLALQSSGMMGVALAVATLTPSRLALFFRAAMRSAGIAHAAYSLAGARRRCDGSALAAIVLYAARRALCSRRRPRRRLVASLSSRNARQRYDVAAHLMSTRALHYSA